MVVKWLPSIVLVDAFQHWVYTSAPENVTPADLDAKWLELSIKFEAGVDWSGLEQERAMGWQRVSMIFTAPFYQIEYALAHLGALQLWLKAQNDFASVWHTYRKAVLLNNAQPCFNGYTLKRQTLLSNIRSTTHRESGNSSYES